jgi:conjugal transfer pilus assembly protein TraW
MLATVIPAIALRRPKRSARRAAFASVASLLATSSALALATDLGKLGPTYPVAEQSLLAMIDERLRARAESGELQRLMDRAVTGARASIATPAPVAGLAACTKARSYYFDPSMVLAENVFDGAGHLLFAAGTRQNPLDVVSLSRALLFFDGRDPRQRKTAQRMLRERGQHLKLILTGGSYMDLMRQWGVPVFYDQQGLLTRRLGIRQVPALVSQEGRRLRIDEMEIAP